MGLTPMQWKYIVSAPIVIGRGVSDASLDLDSSRAELKALVETCEKAKQEYKGNNLVQKAVIQCTNAASKDSRLETNPENLQAFLLELDSFLSRMPAMEAKEYKEFLYQLAENVAKAYSESFLGLGGSISRQEREVLEMMKRIFFKK
ncbi:MAG: hypothetical protein ACLFQV_06800 [Vulcanimicrobiota bacterium]